MGSSRSALRNLGYALDGVPFVHVASPGVSALDFAFALDGVPFVVPAMSEPPESGWGCTVIARPWSASGRESEWRATTIVRPWGATGRG